MKKDSSNTITQLSQRLARLYAYLDAHENELDPETIWDICEECESLKAIIYDLQEDQFYDDWGNDGFE